MNTSLDEIDRQLLSLLQTNAREGTALLARKLGLARTTVVARIARLERSGVVAGYGVRLGTRLDASPTESGENIGKLTVVMANGGSEALEARETEALRASMKQHPGAQVDFSRPELFSFSTPLEVELRGQDLASIEHAGQKLAALLRTNPHYADVKSTVEQGFPEIQIRFDQERAGALGLTTRQIADVVVKKVRGEVATRYSFRDRKIDVLVRAQEGDRASVESIRQLIVNPGSARPVTLSAVADVVATTGPSEIHRADQVRVAIVSANLPAIVKRGLIDADAEMAVAEKYRKSLRIKTPTVDVGVATLSGGNQQKVVLAKWMFPDPQVLILDEPTSGVDPVLALETLRTAVAEGTVVDVVLVGASGAAERRRVRPMAVDQGRVRMRDAARDVEISVAVHRIAAAVPVQA